MPPKTPKQPTQGQPAGFTGHAEDDLDFLGKHHKNVRQHFRTRVQPSIEANPHDGEPLRDELEGVWVLHFWNDKYRVAYVIDEEQGSDPQVIVVGVGLKDGFYDTIADRIASIGGETP